MQPVPEETREQPEKETSIKVSGEEFEPLEHLIAILKERGATPIVESKKQ